MKLTKTEVSRMYHLMMKLDVDEIEVTQTSSGIGPSTKISIHIEATDSTIESDITDYSTW